MENKDPGERKIVVGGVYRHFKGDYYQVREIALDCETLQELVIYASLYYKQDKETRVWARPLEDFMGKKELEDGTVVDRFEFVSER